MTPDQWARVLHVGSRAAEQETISNALQPGHLPGPLAAALSAMAREAEQVGRETSVSRAPAVIIDGRPMIEDDGQFD